MQTDDDAEKIERLGNNEIIDKIVTNPLFAEHHPEVWEQYFRAKVEARESALDWFRSVQKAADSHGAALQTSASHPDYNELLHVKVIVVDLIIDDDPNPLRKVTKYLNGLYAHRRSRGENLPLVVLVSQNAAELDQHRQEFRQDAQISASMLRILDKAEMKSTAQGDVRFELLWQQMVDEQELANLTSNLIDAIGQATEQADRDVRRLAWNLDCDALLRMYQTCVDDGAAFADHLIEFVARSLAWQIRGYGPLRAAIDGVEETLRARATSGANDLARRFHSAGQKDEAAMRELMHHFHWVPCQTVSVTDLDVNTLPQDLARRVPYGAVLAFGLVQLDQMVYIHITQPCDLLRFQGRFETDSLLFVEGAVIGYGEAGGDSPAKWIVRALNSGDQFFDLEIALKRSFAMPARECIEKLNASEAVIVGQLRADTAREISQQFARHVSRIDQPRFTDMRSIRYRMIIGEKQHPAEFLTQNDGNRHSARAILRTLPDKKECFHLLDAVPEQLAIRCQQQFGDTDLRAIDVADALKGEIEVSPNHVDLGSHCDIRVITKEKEIRKALKCMNSKKPVGIVLVPEEVADTIGETSLAKPSLTTLAHAQARVRFFRFYPKARAFFHYRQDRECLVNKRTGLEFYASLPLIQLLRVKSPFRCSFVEYLIVQFSIKRSNSSP